MSGTENILKVFARADQIDLDEGLAAYFHYREMMCALGSEYGYSLERVAAAFACLSPNNDYIGNLRSLVTAMSNHKKGVPVDDITVSTYHNCARRAYLYLDGVSFLSHAKGSKIRSFYINITTPWLPHYVTIDGHMVSVWKGRRYRMKEVAEARFNYEQVADDFRLVAHRLGVLANQLQAVCWFVWKRINGVVYDNQLSLLRPSDQWRLKLLPEEIKPFVKKAAAG